MKSRFALVLLFAAAMTSCSSFNSLKVSDSLVRAPTASADVWDGTYATSFSEGDGSQSNPYKIKTAKELSYFQKSLSLKSYYQNKYLVLDVDIDLNNLTWPGIGTGAASGAFKGNFDGNGHTISGMKMEVTAERKGFFNSNSGTVSNLNVEGNLTGGVEGGIAFGLFAGINYGNISNCSSKGTLSVTGVYVAGFIGCNAGGNLTNCVSQEGKIEGSNCVGGVVGYNMVSSNKIGSLNNCKNYASITAKDYPEQNYSGLGGIIGVCGSGAIISNCTNYGNVIGLGNSIGGTGGIIGNNFNTAINGCINEGEISAKNSVGGIVGLSRNASTYKDCENKGKIIGNIGVGGIVGFNRANIDNCINRGEIEADKNNISYWVGGIVGMLGSNLTVNRSSNYGYVHGLGSINGGVGGIVGSNYSSTVSRCDNNALVR